MGCLTTTAPVTQSTSWLAAMPAHPLCGNIVWRCHEVSVHCAEAESCTVDRANSIDTGWLLTLFAVGVAALAHVGAPRQP